MYTEDSLKELKTDVKRLKRMLENHIQDAGTTVHALSQPGVPGFVEYEDLQKGVGKRILLAQKTDVLTLEEGIYECYTDVNTPKNELAIWNINVQVGFEKRKTLTIIHSGSGRTYTRTFHTNNQESTPSGWARVLKEYVVFEGSASERNKKYTLSQKITNFEMLRIEFQCLGNMYSFTGVVATSKTFCLTANNLPNVQGDTGFAAYELEGQFIDENINFSISRLSGYSKLDPSNPIVISRIIGIN